MVHRMKRWVGVVLVAAAVFSVIGTAAAQGPGGRGRGPAEGMRMERGLGFGWHAQVGAHLLDAVMDATGLGLVEVQSALRDGQTLTEVIEANGGDVQAVVDSVSEAVTAEIDAAVADGTLAEARAAILKEQLPTALDRALTAQHPLGSAVRGWVEEWGEAPRGRMMERGHGMGGGWGMMDDCPWLEDDDASLDT